MVIGRRIRWFGCGLLALVLVSMAVVQGRRASEGRQARRRLQRAGAVRRVAGQSRHVVVGQ